MSSPNTASLSQFGRTSRRYRRVVRSAPTFAVGDESVVPKGPRSGGRVQRVRLEMTGGTHRSGLPAAAVRHCSPSILRAGPQMFGAGRFPTRCAEASKAFAGVAGTRCTMGSPTVQNVRLLFARAAARTLRPASFFAASRSESAFVLLSLAFAIKIFSIGSLAGRLLRLALTSSTTPSTNSATMFFRLP